MGRKNLKTHLGKSSTNLKAWNFVYTQIIKKNKCNFDSLILENVMGCL